MDFRKIFNDRVSPVEFDKWRTRYCDQCFDDIIAYAGLGTDKEVLEIGPGTGQATEPILKTGCSYLGIELGEKFTEAMRARFRSYPRFRIVNADFETYDFGEQRFDLVYSAATIQWIPEQIAFPKIHHLLNDNGALAMMFTQSDLRSPNEVLSSQIDEVYKQYFHPATEYTCTMAYTDVENYGFTDVECRHYPHVRELTADDFVSWTMIQAPHLTLHEPDKPRFITGLKEAIENNGGVVSILDDIVVYLARKPHRKG